MKCNHCQTSMALIREESSNRSVVRWHRCPTCGSAHMLSEPLSEHTAFFDLMAPRQEPEFRAANTAYSSAYSGPERRSMRRHWLR